MLLALSMVALMDCYWVASTAEQKAASRVDLSEAWRAAQTVEHWVGQTDQPMALLLD